MAVTTPYFEDVDVGSELPALVKEPNQVQLFLFSAVTWNPHRIHYDKDWAQYEKHPDVVVHGPLHGAFLSQLVTDWMGPRGRLRRLGYSNRGSAFPGDTLTCRGIVQTKRVQDGKHLVECEIWIENQRGEKLTPGAAVIELPSREMS